MLQLSPRQIHLDFHTSKDIPNIAKDFNPQEFANCAKEAHVSSMTIFARCHHGYLYYPSQKFPELIHPQLVNKNLLLQQVDALHQVGIKAPVYITVQWDYHSATTKPSWLIRKKNGAHEGSSFTEPGFYQSLCVNTEYYEFLKAQTIEVCEILGDQLDGVFFDIVGIRPCWCASCRKEMKESGIDIGDDEAVRAFAKFVIDRFKKDMTEVVRHYSKDCSIFYNAGHVGPCTLESKTTYTHYELESLPSGGWGYLHFPVTARYARTLGKDCLGMTGKFHTSWGDFHSLKNLEALEFECFRMLSYGFACSIGDQLEPYGRLNPATYKLIGKVYKPYEALEKWARPSRAVVEAALVTSEPIGVEGYIPETILGAAQMLEELCIQFDIIDPSMDLETYQLIFLPEDLTGTKALQEKINTYIAKGGKIIACGKAALSKTEEYPKSFSMKYQGERVLYPDFVVAEGRLAEGLEQGNEYAIYKQGVDAVPQGAEILLEAHTPFFKREKETFCSHQYTPSTQTGNYPVAMKAGNVVLFTHPLFTQYRENAPKWCKQLIANAIDLLIPNRLIRHNGPSTLSVTLLDQPHENRYTLHMLSYIPVRKSATIDIIEERTPAYQVELQIDVPKNLKEVRLYPQDIVLECKEGKVVIPQIDGYGILVLQY